MFTSANICQDANLIPAPCFNEPPVRLLTEACEITVFHTIPLFFISYFCVWAFWISLHLKLATYSCQHLQHIRICQGANSKAKAFKIRSPKDWVAANHRHPIYASNMATIILSPTEITSCSETHLPMCIKYHLNQTRVTKHVVLCVTCVQ